MLMNIDNRLFVEIVPHLGSEQSRPLEEGNFDANHVYKVLGMHSPSPTGESYFILADLQKQICFIPRHSVRAYALIDSDHLFLKLPSREKNAPAIPGMAGQLSGRLSGGVHLTKELH